MTTFNFDVITEHLYVGSRFDPGDWFELAALNITVDVNLQIERHDHFMGNAPEIYLWLPIPDMYGPSVPMIRTAARFIQQMVEEDRRVYVHCTSGVGRAPSLAIGYLISTGLSIDAAIRLIKEKRPATKLSTAQHQQIREFAAQWNRT